MARVRFQNRVRVLRDFLRRERRLPSYAEMMGLFDVRSKNTVAGAVERMYQHLYLHCSMEPACIMAGGAGWKMVPSMTRPFELVDNLIFEGLLVMAQQRWK